MTEKDTYREALTGDGCLSLDELEALREGRAEAGRTHVDRCHRCRAELALLAEFHQGAAGEDPDAVKSITEHLRKNSPVPVKRNWWSTRLVPIAAAAGIAVMAVFVGLSLRVGQPGIQGTAETDVMRSASIEGLTPTGDLQAAPAQFEWKAVSGASQYDVKLMEVDRNPIWTSTTSATSILLPEAVRAKMLPFKTLLWEVSARGPDGRIVRNSPTQRIRVVTHSGGKN